MQQHETNSKFVKHMACENCGSSDANSLYDDGHTYCFSCHTTVGANQDMQAEQVVSINRKSNTNYILSQIDDGKLHKTHVKSIMLW